MIRTARRRYIRRRVCAICVGLTLSTPAIPFAHAQSPVSFSALTGQPNLTAIPGQNAAQQAMSGSINNFCPTVSMTAVTPDQVDLKTICSAMIGNALQLQGQTVPAGMGTYGLSTSGLQGALQGLNGGAELLVPTSQASVAQTTQTTRQTTQIENRLKELRNQTNSTIAAPDSPSGEQLATLSAAEPGEQLITASNQVPPFSYSRGPIGVFINGLGQFGSRDLTSSENGYSFNNAGFITGADLQIIPQLIAGAAFGYTQSNTNFDTSSISASSQSLNGNLLQGNLYATYFPNDTFYLNGIGIIGGGNNDSKRRVIIPSADPATTPSVDRFATGNFGSRIAGFTFSGGYNLFAGPIVLTPIGRFLYQHTNVDAFGEDGAMGADLQYGSSSINTVDTFLGADAQYLINTSIGAVLPIARFRWAHQYNPGNTSVTVAYSNDTSTNLLSSFILPSTPTSRNYYDLGVGISLQLARGRSAYISYDSILGISHTSFNSFSAGIRMTF
jgi:outer membrane autotransporter protein